MAGIFAIVEALPKWVKKFMFTLSLRDVHVIIKARTDSPDNWLVRNSRLDCEFR